MGTPSRFGWNVESTYGQYVATTQVVPVTRLLATQGAEAILDQGERGVSDARDYAAWWGPALGECQAGGFGYAEYLGELLWGAMGTRAAISGGYEYVAGEAPPSFSLQWEDTLAPPRRAVYHLAGGRLVELTIAWDRQGVLEWEAAWQAGAVGRVEAGYTERRWAQDAATWDPAINGRWSDGVSRWGDGTGSSGTLPSWDAPVVPSGLLVGWGGEASVGVTPAALDARRLTITLARPATPTYGAGLLAPSALHAGVLGATMELEVPWQEAAQLTRYTAKTQEPLELTVTQGTTELYFRAYKTDFGESPPEVDRKGNFAVLTYHCRALYNSNDEGPCLWRLVGI